VNALAGMASHARGTLPLELLAGLTLLSLAPFAVVMCTSFVRIAVVLSLVRSAIGTQALPPNTVITGLALALTMVVMAPTLKEVSRTALDPYEKGKISQAQFIDRAARPMRAFMLHQTRSADIELFGRVARSPRGPAAQVPTFVLVPAFVVGELRDGFAIGFALYLPFVAIDLAVASILMGLGMFMLSPPVISLPAKLLLFVMIDGWALVCGGGVSSFR